MLTKPELSKEQVTDIYKITKQHFVLLMVYKDEEGTHRLTMASTLPEAWRNKILKDGAEAFAKVTDAELTTHAVQAKDME